MSLHDWSQIDLIREVQALRCKLEKYEQEEQRPRQSTSPGGSAAHPISPPAELSKRITPQPGGALPVSAEAEQGGETAAGANAKAEVHGHSVEADADSGGHHMVLRQLVNADFQLLGTLMNTIDEVVMITDAGSAESPQLRMLYVNAAFTRVTGYSREEAVGRSPRMLQGSETHPGVIDGIRQAIKNGQPFRGQVQNHRKDGSTYWCDLHVLPYRNAGGEITHYIGLQTDISAMRGIAHDLELFRILVEQSDEGVVVADADFEHEDGPTMLYVNPAMARMSGYTVEELVGRRPRFLYGPPDEHDDNHNRLNAELRQGRPARIETRNYRKDGSEYLIDLLVWPLLDEHGRATHLFAHQTDVTEARATLTALRRSEERLLEAQQIGRIGSWEYSSSKQRLWWSEELYHMVGLTKGRTLQWETAMTFEADDQFDLANLLRLAALDQLPDAVVTKLRTASGEVMDVQIRMWAESEPGTGGLRICGTTQDITEQKRSEEALLQAKEAAEAANHSKSLFLGVMSHELRTPLNSIMGLTDLLRDQIRDEKHAEYLKLISRASESLLAIIEDILTYAQSEPGQLQLKNLPYSPKELFESVFNSLAPNFRNKGLEIEQVLDPRLPAQFVGDRVRLRQILTNLINNALKFTENGGVLCQVHYLPEQPTIRVIITDTGEGIPEEFRERMFQPFSQADSSSTRKHGGAGLGLAICKRLLDLMGGTIELQSAWGEGTTFTLMIPVQVLPEDPAASEQKTQTAAAAGNQPRFGKDFAELYPLQLMVVEDDAMNRRLIRVLLNTLGYQFLEAAHGEAALEMCADQALDVVLLDIQMPGINGYETCELMRKMPLAGGQPYVIALTANAMAGDREKCLEAGMDDYMAKPIRLAQLAAKLEEAFKSVQARR